MIFHDHLGRKVNIKHPIQRIISLCPSQTELLFDLGLEEKIVGITQFCIHPKEKVEAVTKVGGTKNAKPDIIRSLQPDLILAEKEENKRELIEALENEFPVFVTNVESYTDALRMIADVGQITQTESLTQELIRRIEQSFGSIRPIKNYRVTYLIWRKPYMTVGKQTYIQSILEKCGFENIFLHHTGRYPEITLEQIALHRPDIVLLSSEPYPFQEKHVAEIQEAVPEAKIILADGEMFSWYGSRMIQAGKYLRDLIYDL
jgi:ABC-type Fe3+-hydroxamate transport system substrate-binding protein